MACAERDLSYRTSSPAFADMSRTPRSAVSNSNLRNQYRVPSVAATKTASQGSPSKLRVPSTPATRPRPVSPSPSKARKEYLESPKEPQNEKLSLKEQIALRRAEAKKAQTTQKLTGDDSLADGPDAIPVVLKSTEEETIELGRWGVRETIERARTTGNLNLSSRSLPCIPSCLFEVHLGVTPKPLDSVIEPEYPAGDAPKRPRQSRQQTSWFEAQDLVVFKARSNEITLIQPELSLFGSLKVIDLHGNQLKALPSSLTILSSLTTLDVSNNNLTEIPPALFSLPTLTTLNLRRNQLTGLPFAQFNEPVTLPESLSSDGFYQPEISRASEPLPNLRTLYVEHNKLTAASINVQYLPRSITRISLSHNPLGQAHTLITALAKLDQLQEVVLDHALIKDDSFQDPSTSDFPKLQLLDLSETGVTEGAIRSYFANSPRNSVLNFNMSSAPPSMGEVRVSVGKRVIKESWEIEAEQRYLKKKKGATNMSSQKESKEVEKEPWEIEAEQGFATEGARRRARAAASTSNNLRPDEPAKSPFVTQAKLEAQPRKPVEKEQWEIEAEQGLLTEGGRRRLRAQQAAGTSAKTFEESSCKSSPQSFPSLSNSTYYSASTLTLILPPSAPSSRSHARAFSMLATPRTDRTAEDLLVPVPTLPLDVILQQDFASKLQVLNLSNRRADPSFSFPSASFLSTARVQGGILPRLNELIMDGCALGDLVSVCYHSDDGSAAKVQKLGMLEVIVDAFPWLSVLDLSYNNLTSAGLSPTSIERLLVPSDGRKGLKVLRLRGNRLTGLEAFEQVAGLFRGNRQVPDWCLEELDVRDNEVARLPSLLGLIPMDVFLVDGNVFRVPARKVWEREGTKGLLSWLRGRIE